jgi:Ser/Thr protein kinase RdoA (MazF antagonist)
MAPAQRRLAVRQLTHMLRALHQTSCPLSIPPVDFAPQMLTTAPGVSRVGTLLVALDKVRSFAHVDPELIASLITYVKAVADVLEPYSVATFVHGDLTFENVLWDGDQIAALIDFEWARGAPSDLELDVLLRFCAYPFLHVAADYEKDTKAEDYDDVPFWIQEDYPALFEWPRALDRLRLYSIAYDVRDLLANPPTVPVRELSEYHPLRRLARTIAQRSYLDAFAHPEQRM